MSSTFQGLITHVIRGLLTWVYGSLCNKTVLLLCSFEDGSRRCGKRCTCHAQGRIVHPFKVHGWFLSTTTISSTHCRAKSTPTALMSSIKNEDQIPALEARQLHNLVAEKAEDSHSEQGATRQGRLATTAVEVKHAGQGNNKSREGADEVRHAGYIM